jgi:hypothetical protein
MKRIACVATLLPLLAAVPRSASAQRLPPLPPPPVSMEVPHPIPPVIVTPGGGLDLYHQIPPRPVVRPVVVGGYVYPAFYGPFPCCSIADSVVDPGLRSTPPQLPDGWLRFETNPPSAEVYVDGFYRGSADDYGINGRTLDLEPGAHRVQLRANGYAPVEFNVRIVANETTRYRGDLAPIAAVPLPASPQAGRPGAPSVTYVIPNCYAGNRPPVRPLPKGCSTKNMVQR